MSTRDWAPQGAHQADGPYDLRGIIALIEVYPPLHHRHRGVLHPTQHQPPCVARGGGYREPGDLPVGDHRLLAHHVGKASQSGTQHHGGLWDKIRAPAHGGRGGLDPFHFLMHLRHNLSPVLRHGMIPALGRDTPSHSVRSAKTPPVYAASAWASTSIWAPTRPALQQNWGTSRAASSKNVGKAFFVPTGEQPP